MKLPKFDYSIHEDITVAQVIKIQWGQGRSSENWNHVLVDKRIANKEILDKLYEEYFAEVKANAGDRGTFSTSITDFADFVNEKFQDEEEYTFMEVQFEPEFTWIMP